MEFQAGIAVRDRARFGPAASALGADLQAVRDKGVRQRSDRDRGAAGLPESAKPDRIAAGPSGNSLMRLPFLVVCWLAAAVSGAAAETPTVAEQIATVTGITITKIGTYTAQTTSAPARPGQETPTGTVGTDVNWHFVLDSP